jgi:hypothetical protein
LPWSLASLALSPLTMGDIQLEAVPDYRAPTAYAQAEARAVEPPEREEIEKYLFLDEDLIYSLIPAYSSEYKYYNFMMEGQVKAGQTIFQEMRESVYHRLCVEWRLCDKLARLASLDDIALVALLADIIAPVVPDVPPTIVAALIVKLGPRSFCRCMGA